MTDLAEEVKTSFERCRANTGGRGPFVVINAEDDELAPNFTAMRTYYQEHLQAVVRQGYHHYAGTVMPDETNEVLSKTSKVMLPLLLENSLCSFCEGVMMGHRNEYVVKMALFYEQPDHLYHTEEFRDLAKVMAQGFADDTEILTFFKEFIAGALLHLAQVTGYTDRNDLHHNKVWDVWLMASTAMVATSYLAGHTLGQTWRERDTLQNLEISLQGVSDESGGEAD
ncbi:MAG TPA: hypothetical protein VKG92_00350, partial [Flavobacteriales bacterium]|nr:hypothetical protein [Flavobacteriales bacterium]